MQVTLPSAPLLFSSVYRNKRTYSATFTFRFYFKVMKRFRCMSSSQNYNGLNFILQDIYAECSTWNET